MEGQYFNTPILRSHRVVATADMVHNGTKESGGCLIIIPTWWRGDARQMVRTSAATRRRLEAIPLISIDMNTREKTRSETTNEATSTPLV